MRFRNITPAEQAAIDANLIVLPSDTFSEAYLKRSNQKHAEALKDAIVRNLREQAKAAKRAERFAKATERRAAKEARHLAYAERCRKARAKRREMQAKRKKRSTKSKAFTRGVTSRPRLTVSAMEWLAEHGFDDPAEYNDGFSGLRERDAASFEQSSAEDEEVEPEPILIGRYNKQADDDFFTELEITNAVGEYEFDDDDSPELTEEEKAKELKKRDDCNQLHARNCAEWRKETRHLRNSDKYIAPRAQPPASKSAPKPVMQATASQLPAKTRRHAPNPVAAKAIPVPPAAPAINPTLAPAPSVATITPKEEIIPVPIPVPVVLTLWDRIEGKIELAVAALEIHGFNFGETNIPKTVTDLRKRIEAAKKWALRSPTPIEVLELAFNPSAPIPEAPKAEEVKPIEVEPPVTPTTVINITINVNVTQVITPVAEKSPWEKIEEASNLEAIVAALEQHGFRFGLVKPKSVAELRHKIEMTPKWGLGPMEVIKTIVAEA